MLNLKNVFPIVLCWLFGNSNVLAQGMLSELEEYTVIRVTSTQAYSATTTIRGKNQTNNEQRVYFTLNETEHLDSKAGTYVLNGKKRTFNFDHNFSVSTINWHSVFNGLRTYSLAIPPQADFEFTYTLSGTETLFLTDVRKTGNHHSTYNSVEIHLPDDLEITVRGREQQYTGQLFITDTFFLPDETRIFYLIHPKNTDPDAYFQDWFLTNFREQQALDETRIPQELELLARKGKTSELAAACFQYVQNTIQYLDIENGLNAIIPREANQTLQNKYGDCKDMAMLLHQLLKHFGFESYLSISRTSDRQETYNFPSLALANHMIVTLVWEGQNIFLDATESNCLFGDPSIQIMGTEAFLIERREKPYVRVPMTLQHESGIRFHYSFYTNANQEPCYRLQMTFREKFARIFDYLNQSNAAAEKIQELTSFLIPYSHTIDSTRQTEHQTTLFISAVLPGSYYNKIGTKCYIDLKTLPDLIQVLRLAYGQDYALFPAPFEVELDHLRAKQLPEEPENFQVIIGEQHTSLRLYMNTSDTQSSNQLPRLWKTFTSKPAILAP